MLEMNNRASVLCALIMSAFLPTQPAFGNTKSRDAKMQFQIGHIYLYGYAGLDVKHMLDHFPVHVGDTLQSDAFKGEAQLIRRAVMKATGRPATDVAWVCCDEARHLLLYIGLSGASSRRVPFRAAPTGSEHLDAEAMQLYQTHEAAIQEAVERGASGEDDSRGFALSNDPSARSIELAMRAYAAERGTEIEGVLNNSADPEQREAAACQLGYANRSPAQIDTLIQASDDPDTIVRNNALRALSVLFSSNQPHPTGLNIAPVIDLLWSGQWTDRNKASALLASLTRNSDPRILEKLRDGAMPPLLEGAHWDSGHSAFFLFILGRIAAIPPAQLEKLWAAGDKEQIISAAEKSVHADH